MLWLAAIRDAGGGACGSSNQQETGGSLILHILLCCLIVVYIRSCLSFEGKQTCCEKSLPGSLRRLVHYVGNRRCTVTVYSTSGAKASGNAGGSRPRVDRSGVSFRHKVQTSWNTHESYVIELDTSVVPDVLDLRACYQNAEPTLVLPGRAQNTRTVCVC